MKKTIAIAISLIIVITTMFSAGMITTSAATLKTPVVTKTEVVANGIKLNWSKVRGAAKYRVFVKTSRGWKSLGNTTATTWTDKTAKTGKSYTYTVRCITKNGRRYTSSFYKKGYTVSRLATPKITKTEGSESGTKITWNKVSGAYQYRVFVKTAKGWKVLGNTKLTSWTDKTAVAGKTNIYTVRCLSSNKKVFTSYFNSTGFSAIRTATPLINQASSASDGLTLTWNKVAGAGQYRVFLKSESGWIKLADTKNTQYTYADVQDGQSYTFTVRALSANGRFFVSSFQKDGFTAVYNAYGTDTTPTAPTENKDPDELPLVPAEPTSPTTPDTPVAPTTPTINYVPTITGKEISNNKIKFTWNKLSGIYTYAVYYKNGNNWQLLNDEVSSTTYSYSFNNKAGNYSFSVIACNPDTDKPYGSPDQGIFTCTVKYVVDQVAYSYLGLSVTSSDWKALCCCNKCGADLTGTLKEYFNDHPDLINEAYEKYLTYMNGKYWMKTLSKEEFISDKNDWDMFEYHTLLEPCGSGSWHSLYYKKCQHTIYNSPEKGHFELVDSNSQSSNNAAFNPVISNSSVSINYISSVSNSNLIPKLTVNQVLKHSKNNCSVTIKWNKINGYNNYIVCYKKSSEKFWQGMEVDDCTFVLSDVFGVGFENTDFSIVPLSSTGRMMTPLKEASFRISMAE